MAGNIRTYIGVSRFNCARPHAPINLSNGCWRWCCYCVVVVAQQFCIFVKLFPCPSLWTTDGGDLSYYSYHIIRAIAAVPVVRPPADDRYCARYVLPRFRSCFYVGSYCVTWMYIHILVCTRSEGRVWGYRANAYRNSAWCPMRLPPFCQSCRHQSICNIKQGADPDRPVNTEAPRPSLYTAKTTRGAQVLHASTALCINGQEGSKLAEWTSAR